MQQLRCDGIHMPGIREQETQRHTQIHGSSPGAGFTLHASEIMAGSSSKLSRIKTHRTNITSIDFYLGLFLTIFHKSILLRNPLCPLNTTKNETVQPFWHTSFPSLSTFIRLLSPPPPKELGDTSVWAFVKLCYPISQALTNSSSPPGDVQWAELLFYTKPLVPHENRWVTKLCCQWKGADLSLLKMYDRMWASPSPLTDREIGEWLCNLKKRK